MKNGLSPADRAVHAHQRDRVQVADDAIGLDRLVGHFFLTGLSKSGLKRGQERDRWFESGSLQRRDGMGQAAKEMAPSSLANN